LAINKYIDCSVAAQYAFYLEADKVRLSILFLYLYRTDAMLSWQSNPD